MARIKIEDLPVLEDLSAKERKGIFGGLLRTAAESEEDGAIEQQYEDGTTTTEGKIQGWGGSMSALASAVPEV